MMTFSAKDVNGEPFDIKLSKILGKNKDNSIFIELGAFDGVFQSNTLLLELLGYNGILIEPSKDSFNKLIKNRSDKNDFYNKACVSFDYKNNVISGDFKNGSPMSSINGERRSMQDTIEVPCDTLSSIVENSKFKDNEIAFLSLDCEGYELSVLKGYSFKKRPKYVLIEIYTKDFEEITKFMESHDYELIANFSGYTKERCPHWDGTHNDYLFRDKLLTN